MTTLLNVNWHLAFNHGRSTRVLYAPDVNYTLFVRDPTILYYTSGTLHYTTLHYTTVHYTTVHYTTLHFTTLLYTTLHYTTLK